jgi:hypothetical protein
MTTTKKKHCNGCDRDLPETEFHLRRRDQPWRQARCKDCMSAYLVRYRLVHHNIKDIP